VAVDEGGIAGVLPLFACRSLRGSLGLYSLPFTVYGGPAGTTPEAERALLEAARALARRRKARKIEFRNRYPNTLALAASPGFVTFERELPADPDVVYRSLPKKAREAVNQAIKRHRLEADPEGDLDTFYDLLASSYLRLGTPVFPRAFFAAIRREFPRSSGILLVRHEGTPVAAVLYVVFRGIMMPLYSGEAPNVAHLKTGNFKYLRLMQRAVENGIPRFDFGRSRIDNPGVVQFKTNQGFEPEVLPYQVESLDGAAGGEPDPTKGWFLKARRIWSRLPPRVAKALGPRVIRYFP
jgi:FemAB-related protein (PEP-CTERM system-associated)